MFPHLRHSALWMPSEAKHRQHTSSAANPPHLCPPVARCRSRRFFHARRQAYYLCDVRPVARSEAFIIRSDAWSIRYQRPLSAPGPARFCRAARCCRLSPLLLGPLNTIRCQLEGKEIPRAAVDTCKAPSSPNRHGLRPPFGRALLSMPVRLLPRLTGTACGRLSVAPAQEDPAFSQRREEKCSRHPSPQAPHLFPSAFIGGGQGHEPPASPFLFKGAKYAS